MSLIKEQIDQDRNPERFTELKISTDLYPGKGEDCVRIHTVHEDKKAKALSMRSGNMVMELLALTCAHPKDKRVAVHVVYSERYWPGDRDPEFENRAEQILNSLRLEDF
jgi:hypothetical protein